MFDWKRILLVARREISVRTGQRSYKISLVVQLLIVGLIAMSPILIAMFRGDDAGGPEVYRVQVVEAGNDNTGNTLQAILTQLGDEEDVTWEVSAAESEDAARAAVESGDIDAVVIPRSEGDDLGFDIVSESGDTNGTVERTLTIATSAVSLQDRVEQSGLSPQQQQEIFTTPEITMTVAADENEQSDSANVADFVSAYGGTILIFIFVVIYGQWIAQGVVEEKASRIMEIMINAATPRDLLAGKVIGIMATAIMQFAPIMLLVGLIASFQTTIGGWLGVAEDQLLDVNLGAVAWSTIGWFSLYFFLGFLLFGALYAGVGSMVSRQEEVGTATAPMTTVMMVGYFAALASLGAPDGIVARIAFLFPGTSVFVALVRIILGNPEPWEIAVSIGALIVAIVLAVLLAARLYRVGVLMYGQSPSFKKLFKLNDMQEVAR